MLRRPGRDLVLLEALMPGLDTFSAAADIRLARPSAKIGILTHHNSLDLYNRARKARLNGFILKQDRMEELDYAIKRMLGGGFYTPPSAAPTGLTPQTDDNGLESLTERETSVLTLYAQGLAIKDIANTLHISVKTAETHRNNLRRKLSITTGTLYFSRLPTLLPGRLFGWRLFRLHTHRSKTISGHPQTEARSGVMSL
jgi:DNA-binding NarL/FixJ family response regulator